MWYCCMSKPGINTEHNVCMYKLYLMTVTPGYKVISPRAVLLVKVSIEVQYIY